MIGDIWGRGCRSQWWEISYNNTINRYIRIVKLYVETCHADCVGHTVILTLLHDISWHALVNGYCMLDLIHLNRNICLCRRGAARKLPSGITVRCRGLQSGRPIVLGWAAVFANTERYTVHGLYLKILWFANTLQLGNVCFVRRHWRVGHRFVETDYRWA